jgi:hypothetical protein
MYENKDISILPAMQWSLMHEATALSGYFKKFEETHRAVFMNKYFALTSFRN